MGSEARVTRFHASLQPEQRQTSLARFREAEEGVEAEAALPRILVATGRAAKGLWFGETSDGMGGVGHVVLFEFPPDAKAYIARVGFATRGHAPPARVTALAVAKQLPFAKAMLEQDRGGKRIDLDLI